MDESVYRSEMEHAYRNIAIANMLRGHNILSEDPAVVVDGYTRQCSLLVTARDLALMAATLANRGINPLSAQRVVPEPVVRQVLSVMATCGMYDSAGDWAGPRSRTIPLRRRHRTRCDQSATTPGRDPIRRSRESGPGGRERGSSRDMGGFRPHGGLLKAARRPCSSGLTVHRNIPSERAEKAR